MDDKLTKWKKVLDTLSTEFVTPAEVKRVFDAIVKVFKSFKADVQKETASIKAEMAAFSRRATKHVDEAERRLADKVTASERSIASDLANTRKQLSEAVKALNDAAVHPPELTEAIQEIDGLTARVEALSTLLVAENVRNMLELLQGDDRLDKSAIKGLDEELDAIRNLPRGMGGGVSDMRIRQAFKYILHTEEPLGDIDGVNTAYTVNNEIFAVLAFSLNGETIAELPNYTVAGRTITFSTAIPAAYSGKDFEVKYIG